MEEIPAGECSYIYLTGDFSFGRLPEEEQLVIIPLLMRTLRMAGLGERSFGPLHPEDEEVTIQGRRPRGVQFELHHEIFLPLRASGNLGS